MSNNLHIFDDSQKTICYTTVARSSTSRSVLRIVDEKSNNNNEGILEIIFRATIGDDNNSFMQLILQDLYQRKIQSIIIEGGTILLQSFIDLGLWDEAFILKSKLILADGIEAPKIGGIEISRENLSDNLLVKKKPSL